MTLIHDLLDLPASIQKGDFVLSLASGVERPEETVRDYAITPDLVNSFSQALMIVDSALTSGRSQATYVHGSFGSGKSHFMAMLDLMIQGHAAPWGRGELHVLRTKFEWIGTKKCLQLPLHMLEAQSLEQRIFSSYVKVISEKHPDAPVPPLFADRDLFENAKQFRLTLKDEAFFAALNAGAKGGWGKYSATWDAKRFEEAIESTDLELRGKLFDTLLKTLFPAFKGKNDSFIDLDRGLEVVSRHAKGLGYDAVILYLDELILWLAGKVGNLDFVQNEAQKITKFKEAENERREIPIIAFVARQRSLAELVGERVQGDARTALEDTLALIEGRFNKVTLEDRNLPAVVAHRVVRAKDDSKRVQLDEGFQRARKTYEAAMATLLGSDRQVDDFRKVYPFSPALIDALVAVSDCLQRERTAIRVLMELLVEHVRSLELGQVVPLGDIFDVLGAGDDAFDPIMQALFRRAKDLYQNHLLPILHEQHKTGTQSMCQRLRPGHPANLGCSECPQIACRNDNRLVKTLLLAAFVPNARPFRNLTISRLVHLNPGCVPSMIPGTETVNAVEKVRSWASRLGQIRVGSQADPEVSIRLEGVDLQPILDSARSADNSGNRLRLFKEILFESMGVALDSAAAVVDVDTMWKGTKRPGKLRVGNVRTLQDEAFKCPVDAEWYLLMDYPFDEPGHGPSEDVSRVAQIREVQGGVDNPSLVWLPCFFSEKIERELGQLAVIEEILAGNNVTHYLNNLSPQDQARARGDLSNLKGTKRTILLTALCQAYGITQKQPDTIDTSRSVDEHFESLMPGLPNPRIIAAGFADMLKLLSVRILEHRHPHHPLFTDAVTPAKLEKVGELIERILDAQDHRIQADRTDQRLLKDFAQPLRLVQLGETTAQLDETFVREMDQLASRCGTDKPNFAQARRFADEHGNKGLQKDISDLVVWTWAGATGRSFERDGRPFEIEKFGRVPDDVDLVKPELPKDTEWYGAIDRAGALFGLTVTNKALNARNLAALGSKLDEVLAKRAEASRLANPLEARLQDWSKKPEQAPRLTTARSARALLDGLVNKRAVEQIRFLAAFEPKNSQSAMVSHLNTAKPVFEALQSEAQWLTFQAVRDLLSDPGRKERAGIILGELDQALSGDQVNFDLPKILADLTREATPLFGAPPPTGWIVAASPSFEVSGAFGVVVEEARTRFNEELLKLEARGDKKITVRIVVHEKAGGGKA